MTKRLAVLSALAVCWVSPASAQYALPTPYAAMPSDRPLSDNDKAREMLNQYGYCVVMQHLGGVQRALALGDDAATDGALRKLATDDCLFAGKLRMSPPLFRGAIYRAMYVREFGYLSQGARAAVIPANGQPGEEVDAAPSITFGGCVAKLAPAAARDLVMATPASRNEDAALATLRPTLADCLPPKQQVRLTRWGLQATVAEALYKRTVALSDKTRAVGAK
ncbi:MAG: hypothetical protein E7773_12120 [Sphingomonas sp.]|uniref:hypothetical protein n=1 Tax=Sphingomonas sp. TaxID=28214 RepID=UPI0012280B2D|nr:hypothetical protein [Sphingomonas sp.]THD35192.1 MAG: hypothetical protein E7773_12120 [Sphingomonas sp.]